MRKLLLSSIVLFLFSASILIFQVSCKKEANAESGKETVDNDKEAENNEGIILLDKWEGDRRSLFTAKLDGTDLKQVSLNFQTPLQEGQAKLISNGKKIVISGEFYNRDDSHSNYHTATYICNIDGSNLKKLENLNEYWLQDAY